MGNRVGEEAMYSFILDMIGQCPRIRNIVTLITIDPLMNMILGIDILFLLY